MSKKVFLKGTLILACTDLSAVLLVSFIGYSYPMPLVRKVLVCIS